MNLYTSEQSKSYSGALVQEFVCDGVSFWITKGMSRSIKTYGVSVKHDEQDLFTIYTYEGDYLYGVLAKEKHANSDIEIATRVMEFAIKHMSPTKFIGDVLSQAYSKGFREGKQDTQSKMREVLGID